MPGRAVVAPAGGQRRGVERVDALAVVGLEGDVDAALVGLAIDEPEDRARGRAEGDASSHSITTPKPSGASAAS